MKVNTNLLVIILFLFSYVRPLKAQEINIKTDYSQSEEYVKNEKNLVRLGKYQEAILELEEKLILQPNNPVILSLLGKSYEKLNKREKSIDYLTKAITVDRNYPKSFNTLALIKGKQNKFQETINLLDAAIKLDENYAEAYSNRGVAKGALGKNIDAIKDFTKAIEIDPFLSDAYINRGITHELIGNKFSACEDWETASSLGRKEPAKWFSSQCNNSLENKLSKQIKLTNTLQSKNNKLISNYEKEREENLKKIKEQIKLTNSLKDEKIELINTFEKEQEDNLKKIEEQNQFIKLSSDKLFELEEKLDSLLNSNLEDSTPQAEDLILDNSFDDSNLLDNTSNNITASFNLNTLLVFSNILFLLLITAYLYIKFIKKSKLPKSMQKRQLNLLISNVESLNKELTNNEQKIRKMLSQKRKIDDALNNQINANNFIDQERSEILFKIKEIQNEFKKANKKFDSKHENINSDFVDNEDNTINIENLNNSSSSSKKEQDAENLNHKKQNTDNELNNNFGEERKKEINQSSIKNDETDSKQPNISNVDNKKSNDPVSRNIDNDDFNNLDNIEDLNKNSSMNENIEASENYNENQIFRDNYKREKEFLIDLFTNAELKNIEENKLKDNSENNYLLSLYENNFSKLLFNYDLLFNKFLNDIFKFDSKNNLEKIENLIINHLDGYFNRIYDQITSQFSDTKGTNSFMTIIYVPNEKIFEKINNINPNIFSNVSLEKKIFVCNKSLLKNLLEETSFSYENKEESTLDFTLKYLENLSSKRVL